MIRQILRPRIRGVTSVWLPNRSLSASSTSVVDPPKEKIIRPPPAPGEPTILYEGSQALTIRAMLGSGVFNLLVSMMNNTFSYYDFDIVVSIQWWTYYLADYYAYKDVLLEGNSVVASPMFGVVGGFMTAVIAYTTREYARNAVCLCYETADGKRLGFQTHNMFGNPGRKLETPIGNAKIANLKVSSFTSSLIALKLEGMKYNLLLDKDANYMNEERLMEILAAERTDIIDSKENRIAWRKQAIREKNHGDHHGKPAEEGKN